MSETRQIFQCHTLSKYSSSKWEDNRVEKQKENKKQRQNKNQKEEENRGKWFLTRFAKGPGGEKVIASYLSDAKIPSQEGLGSFSST